MKIKIALKYGGFLLAITSIILTGNLDAAAQVKKNKLNELSSALSLEEYTAPATVFGGVGRKFPTLQAGLDLLILSSPHYNAYRNQLELSNRVYWGEWWYSDRWGVKGFLSEQSFTMFGTSGNSPQANTSHLGLLAKTQLSIAESWKISAGLGLAKTEFVLESQRKHGNSLVSEFRIGFKFSADLWTEAGILTIDSTSGSGSGDQRLGSTGYLIGLSYGF
ncbi:uncharacterized protein METZ01_LOCUS51215 [marine metagenome]|uniref:Outer membrane protein beta-barrel domain-containing protein n=1 Tax=marine metagenome TaxID=408172 RepID=A0A381S4X6_9ZZZZ